MTPIAELIVGQRINSSSKSVATALRARDAAFLQTMARDQEAAGAHALDLNVSAVCTRAEEPELLAWAVRVVQDVSDLPLCLDSGNAHALAAAAAQCRVAPIVNSVSPDQIDAGIWDEFDMSREGQRIVVLCTRRALALDLETRLACAEYVAARLIDRGVGESALIFDPLMFPLLSGRQITETLWDAIRALRERWPNAGILCASGNYSHGVADRRSAERECIALSRSAGANVFLCETNLFAYNFR
jgi:5-methyltetrahydrofolate corrinoid/iron sulfur protein methyltransferase